MSMGSFAGSVPRLRTGAAAGRERLSGALAVVPLLIVYLVVCAVAQPGGGPVRDEPDLLAAATRLLHGQLVPPGPVLDPRSYLWHGPGLVAVLAPLAGLHLPLTAMRFLEPVLLGAAVLLFHRLLRTRLAPRPALAWTYALGLYVPFFAVVPELHKEPLAILLVVGGMVALRRALARGGAWPIAGAGLALAALTMVRLEYGWVAIALLGLAGLTWTVRRRNPVSRRLVAVAAVAVAGCVPWLAYTYSLTGKPLYWGTSSGLSLYWMSPTVPGENGEWHEPSAVDDDPALAALRPFFHRLRGLDPVASDQALRDQATANVRAHPGWYARNVAANVTRLLFAVPMRPELSARRIGANVIFNGLLLGVSAWAAAVLWRRRRALPPEVAPVAAFAVLATLAHLPPAASPRMLLPIVPAVVWLGAQAYAARSGQGARRPHVVVGQHPREAQ